MSIIKAIEGQSTETQDKSCQITFTSRAYLSTQVCWPYCCRVESILGYTVMTALFLAANTACLSA